MNVAWHQQESRGFCIPSGKPKVVQDFNAQFGEDEYIPTENRSPAINMIAARVANCRTGIIRYDPCVTGQWKSLLHRRNGFSFFNNPTACTTMVSWFNIYQVTPKNWNFTSTNHNDTISSALNTWRQFFTLTDSFFIDHGFINIPSILSFMTLLLCCSSSTHQWWWFDHDRRIVV